MNPAQLLDHFDRIRDAPDAIPRLRRFVLDLAVRGKLVEQDPNDEPVAELLNRIRAEKTRLMNAGDVRKEKPLAALAAEELPFQLPKDWCWSQPAEIGFVNPRNNAADALLASFVPMTLISAEYGVASQYEIRPWGEIKNGFTHFAEGDVALAKITPCFQNAKSTVFRSLAGGIGAGTTELHVIRPVIVCAEYVLIFLKSPHFIESGIPIMTGTAGQKRVPTDYFAHSPFPLPPLAEQHRIVAKVDQLMALCDRLDAAQAERERRRDRLAAASLQRLNAPADTAAFREHATFHLRHLARLTTRPDQIQSLRESILNLAVRGRLVARDPNDEPAFVLHDRLKSVLAKTQSTEHVRSRRDILLGAAGFFCDVFPPSWVVTNFDNVNAIVSGVAKGKNLAGFKTVSYPYLRVANVQRGYLDLTVVKELEIRPHEFERYRLRRGDVLMTEGGDWDKLGRAAIWNEEIPSCIHQNHIYRIRPTDTGELLPEWIALFANSLLGRSYFEEASKQTTNLASINMTQLRSCPLPLPPTAEQRRIVAKVDELMAVCDRLETQLTTAQTESRRLLEAALHTALAHAG